MSNDLEQMFAQAAGASENKGEGEAAARYIGGDPIAMAKKKAEEAKAAEAEKKRIEEAKAAEAEKKRISDEAKAAETEKKRADEANRVAEAEKKRIADERAAKEAQDEQNRIAAAKAAKDEELEKRRIADEKARVARMNANQAPASSSQAEETIRLQQEINEASSRVITIDTVVSVLYVSDSFRRLDKEVKDSVYKFFSTKDENTTITSILGESEDTRRALLAIVSAQSASDVDRAFFLVSLDEYLLGGMGDLINTYTQKNSVNLDTLRDKKIDYCRALEKAIRGMTQKEKTHLSAIQGLLNIPKK